MYLYTEIHVKQIHPIAGTIKYMNNNRIFNKFTQQTKLIFFFLPEYYFLLSVKNEFLPKH